MHASARGTRIPFVGPLFSGSASLSKNRLFKTKPSIWGKQTCFFFKGALLFKNETTFCGRFPMASGGLGYFLTWQEKWTLDRRKRRQGNVSFCGLASESVGLGTHLGLWAYLFGTLFWGCTHAMDAEPILRAGSTFPCSFVACKAPRSVL